jgi:hypothetical protein
MAVVRVLRAFNGFPCGVYADISGDELEGGTAAGALDPKAKKPADVELHERPESDESAAKPAKKAK